MPEQEKKKKKPSTKKRLIITLSGLIIGGIAGFAYYYFIGCNSGHCPITSNPWISTAYGAVAGAVVAGI